MIKNKIGNKISWLILSSFFASQVCFGQFTSCNKIDSELSTVYARLFSFYQKDIDSLIYYNDLFSSKLVSFLKNNPATLGCNFQTFSEKIGSIVTTDDGMLRIYSWNTWTGGTMTKYNNLFQFELGDQVFVKNMNNEEGDMGTNYSAVYSIKSGSEIHFLAIACGNESSKYGYEYLTTFSISDSTTIKYDQIIRTPEGLKSSMVIEYEYSSEIERLPMIRYDPKKEMFYIPIFDESGKKTNQFNCYQFTGQYFESMKAKGK